jgi:hypothetical protein
MTLSMSSFYIVFYACNFAQNNQVKFNGESDECSSQKILGYVSYNTSGKTASPHGEDLSSKTGYQFTVAVAN